MPTVIDNGNVNIALEDYSIDDAPIVGEFYAIVAVNTEKPLYLGGRIVEIGATIIDAAYNIVEQHHTFINPQVKKIHTNLPHVTKQVLEDAPTLKEANAELLSLLHNKLLVMFPSNPTITALNTEISGTEITPNNVLDLHGYAQMYHQELQQFDLKTVLNQYDYTVDEIFTVKQQMDAMHALLERMFPTHENTKLIASETHVAYFNPSSEGYVPLYALWKPYM